MGLLRLLHAVAVVIAHSTPILGMPLIGGVGAVQTFFMVSGFYMTLILETKYVGPGSYWLFISNRFLRLFPIYWVILALTIASALVYRIALGHWLQLAPFVLWRHELSGPTWLYLLLTNVAIVGQDLLLFLGLDPQRGTLFWTNDFLAQAVPIYAFLLVPQAWSIGLEITFYLVAPFIVRRNVVQVGALVLLSLLLRIYIYYGLNWHFDPWTYRFFPTELAFFLCGTLAYRLYAWLKPQAWPHALAWVVTLLILGLTIFYPLLPAPLGNEELKLWSHYLLILLGLPFAFLATATSKVDRWLGELSYPVYLVHFLIIMLLRVIPGVDQLGLAEGTLALLCSLVAAGLLNVLIANPVEKLRQARVDQASRQRALALPTTTDRHLPSSVVSRQSETRV